MYLDEEAVYDSTVTFENCEQCNCFCCFHWCIETIDWQQPLDVILDYLKTVFNIVTCNFIKNMRICFTDLTSLGLKTLNLTEIVNVASESGLHGLISIWIVFICCKQFDLK